MPKPKISAALNNCPLHILTEQLSVTFSQLAIFESDYSEHHSGQNVTAKTLDQYLAEQLNEIYGISSLDKCHEYIHAYQLLKQCFSEFYELTQDQESLTFQQLSALLNTYQNQHDQQIIFGPVLRAYLKYQMISLSDKTEIFAIIDDLSLEEFTRKLTTIQDTGRYDSLSDDLTAAFIAQPLGIQLIANKSGQPPRSHDLTNKITTLNIYHEGDASGASAGGHWELTMVSDDRHDYSNSQDCQFKNLSDLFALGRQDITEAALEIIKSQVRFSTTMSDQLNSDDIALYAPMIERLQGVARAEIDASTISTGNVQIFLEMVEKQIIDSKKTPVIDSQERLEKQLSLFDDADLQPVSTSSPVDPSFSDNFHSQNHHFDENTPPDARQNHHHKDKKTFEPNYSFMLTAGQMLLGTMAGISLVVIALAAMDIVTPVVAVTIGLATVGSFTATNLYRFYNNNNIDNQEDSTAFHPDIKLD